MRDAIQLCAVPSQNVARSLSKDNLNSGRGLNLVPVQCHTPTC